MRGYVHSIESFGSVDGPGIRMVVFLQGCHMRCLYCHNPDTWQLHTGIKMSVDDILKQYESKIEFYRHGGITVTGGEPLLQLDFLIELFRECKNRMIHTCLDTSGMTFHKNQNYLVKLDQLLEVTDLIMLDIKHIDDKKHQKLTGFSNDKILAFARYIDNKGIPIWIRHVVIPSITFDEEDLYQLGKWLGNLKNLKALDVLPYHTMGIKKYEAMGLDYPLTGIKPLSKEEAKRAKKVILEGIEDTLLNKTREEER